MPIGCNIALTGIILSSLRGSSGDIQMTKEEESWFGTYINIMEMFLTTSYYINQTNK